MKQTPESRPHIRLTSHTGGIGAMPIQWGAPDATIRRPGWAQRLRALTAMSLAHTAAHTVFTGRSPSLPVRSIPSTELT